MAQLINSKSIYWSEESDRHILVIKEGNAVVGINYCQGDDLEYFLENYNEGDKDLTKFYYSVAHYLSGETLIDRINQAIWGHLSYNNE